jgi:HSP20 family protein
MSTQLAPGESPGADAVTPKIVEVESFADRIKGVYESIAERAYELFHGRGGAEGYHLDDWLRAESELLRPTAVEVLESEGEVIVHADVPGFRAKDIEVSVEPTRLTIAGKREESSEQKAGERVYSERTSSEVFRSVSLPTEVEPGNASATLSDGVLTLTMKKARKPEPEQIEIKEE